MTNTNRVAVLGRLQAYGIRTIGDLDRWRNAQRWQDQGGEYIPSRYKALKAIVGEDAADLILNELALIQCGVTS